MVDQREAVLSLLRGGFSQIKILVVGELRLDRYLLGELAEDTVATLRQLRRFERPAGAANVAMNLAGLGCQTFLCGFWGADREQEELVALLEAAGVDVTGVVSSALPTPAQTRLWAVSGDTGRELLRLEIAAGVEAPSEESVRLEARAVELVKKVHAVVLAGSGEAGSGEAASGEAGSGEAVLSDELCGVIVRAARAASIPVVAQAGLGDLSRYSGATLVLASREQLALATGVAGEDSAALMDGVRERMEEHEIQHVAAGMGGGLIVLGPDGAETMADGAYTSAADAGAAQAVIAILGAALTAGVGVGAAAELAMLGAAIAAAKIGTAPVGRQELIAASEAARLEAGAVEAEASDAGSGLEPL